MKPFAAPLFAIFTVVVLTTGCQRAGSGAGTDGTGGTGFGNALNGDSTAGGTALGNGGSGSGGALTDTDKQALGVSLAEAQAQAPKDPEAIAISDALQAELDQLRKDQEAGRDVSVQKLALAGKLLQECAGKVAKLAPYPGQTLLGQWASAPGQGCATNFIVTGAGPLQPQTSLVYQVTGGTAGQMTARADGTGVIEGKPWMGGVRDTPTAGNGVLRNIAFTPATSGKNAQAAKPCDTNVTLAKSANPIPENSTEAARQLGLCYRRALVLMSPLMDQMFQGMDSALAKALQEKFLSQ